MSATVTVGFAPASAPAISARLVAAPAAASGAQKRAETRYSDIFGTPEPAMVLYTVAALARRLGVPFRSGGSLTASKVPDAQAAYESVFSLMYTIPDSRRSAT